ncbi:protein maelstrom homolog [Ochlerotatus camptorhynchus]|uniref:protein maelstrom homolog n=1 Tax=Ochlerotatus camptorhynchus TaxID=644619 RepID=UPI0031D7A1D4
MLARSKSAPRGPFFLFMLEFRRREESKGKSFPGGMDQLVHEARSSWKLLSEAERLVYKDQSLAYRNQQKQNTNQKGVPLSMVEIKQRKRTKQQKTIDKAISEMIQRGMRKNVLEKLEMFFISVNHFCKTHTSDYVPAEMAIIRYSLENGILGKFHELINPAKLPLGLTYEASEYSEETHALPIPPNALGETDFGAVLQKVLAFTGYNKPHKLFPLLTDAKEVAVVESVLTQLNKESKTNYQFLVISLGEFFYHLKRGTEKYGLDICIFPDKTIAEILLKNDVYEYTSGIACDFHENLGNPKCCALSKVSRWTYIISNNCCPDLSIDLIAGSHMPLNTEASHLYESTPSNTMLRQVGEMSLVSSSAQSHFTLPQIQRRHAKSPSRSCAGTSKDVKMDTAETGVATMNSFYMVESVYGSSFPMKGTGKQTKLIPVRQSSSGRGRGILLANNLNEPSSIGFYVKGTGKGRGEWLADNSISSVLQGAGRGQSLLIGSTSIGIDPTYCQLDSMDMARGRGSARRQSSVGKTSSYRQPYSSDGKRVVKGPGDSQTGNSNGKNSLVRQLNNTGIAKGRGELLADSSFSSMLQGASWRKGIFAEHSS